MENKIVIYQTEKGEIEFKGHLQKETIWASLQQIADLFETDKSGISRHIKNIYDSKELDQSSTVAVFATVQTEGNRQVKRDVEYYNLDLILSVGYRVNSKRATRFRQWATTTLREHITQGYTLNRNRISNNYHHFLQAVESVKQLLPPSGEVPASGALELILMFADTWLSLDAYDRSTLPQTGASKKQVAITAEELATAIQELKNELIRKEQATGIFAQERQSDAIGGIVGTVFQSVFGEDAYPTVEEKAAHLLYFIVKNHPFTDGNKRSGAFAFIWFLNKAGLLQQNSMTPEALTALTLLVAESKPQDKERIVGLVLQLLRVGKP